MKRKKSENLEEKIQSSKDLISLIKKFMLLSSAGGFATLGGAYFISYTGNQEFFYKVNSFVESLVNYFF